MKYFLISLIFLTGVFLEWNLYLRWQADISYNTGKTLNTAQKMLDAYPYLNSAVESVPDEPTFLSELAYNQAVLASAIFAQTKLATSAAQLTQLAIENSNKAVSISPNSLPFWKDRLKIFFQLSSIDEKYNSEVLTAINKGSILAPTDAKVHYLKGWILERAGKTEEAIKILRETLVLKPDYNDAKVLLEKIEKSQK